jgi:hypothetical protein
MREVAKVAVDKRAGMRYYCITHSTMNSAMSEPIPRWGRRLADRPFRVLAEWIEFAHWEDAQRGRPPAARLIAEPVDGGRVSLIDPALVAEVVAVAERIAADPESPVRRDERLWFRLYAASIAKRGKQWLRAVEVVGHG